MKDNFIASALMVAFMLWNFCILFGLWGGNPEGAFVKIKKLEARIITLEKAKVDTYVNGGGYTDRNGISWAYEGRGFITKDGNRCSFIGEEDCYAPYYSKTSYCKPKLDPPPTKDRCKGWKKLLKKAEKERDENVKPTNLVAK